MNDFYSDNKKVGIIILNEPANIHREHKGGLVDIGSTNRERFIEALKIIKNRVDLKSQIENFYSEYFNSKNKKTEFLKMNFDISKNEQIHKSLKGKGINQVIIVKVEYGLLLSYYNLLEIAKNGYCQINSEILDLDNNSVIYKNTSKSIKKTKGNWKKSEYQELTKSISLAIESAIKSEKNKFRLSR
ncbi:hypothetical protein [Polaribacter vadi]|uniref:hypothetical protein n=1 Tax=Polaribacter vadi TaxID=1774273 RepID=UPI0030EDDF98